MVVGCIQVFLTVEPIPWLLELVDKWLLLRARFGTKIGKARLIVVVIDRWLLFGGGHITGLTVYNE